MASAVLLGVVLTLAGCSGAPTGSLSVTPGPNAVASLVPGEEGTPGPSDAASADTPGAVASPSAPLVSPVRGIVLRLESPDQGTVTGFTLLADDSRQLTFRVGVIENGGAFPATHLAERMAASQPVLVFFRVEGADLVAYRLEDGPPTTVAPSPPADSASDAPAPS